MVTEDRPLSPEQKLVFYMFERAARDLYCDDISTRLDARRWLFGRGIYSAEWWGELAGLEVYLECFRRIKQNPLTLRRYAGRRTSHTTCHDTNRTNAQTLS